jgi:ATP-dependent DNA ligase
MTQQVAVARHFEGVVAKRLDSAYLAGQRSPAWTKVKATKRDEFVVGGWLPGEGNREGRIGALLVGLPEDDGQLTYCGGVGTGFTDKELRRLKDRLGPLVTTASPFTTALPRRDAVFVRPEVVVDVEYRERTTGGILRQPSYKGERMDKSPADVETGAHGGARRQR